MGHLLYYNSANEVDTTQIYESPGVIKIKNQRPVYAGYGFDNYYKMSIVNNTVKTRKYEAWRETYQEVEYLQSTGTQYINTGITVNGGYTINLKYKDTPSVSSYRHFLFGYNGDDKECMFNIKNTGYCFWNNTVGSNDYTDFIFSANTIYDIEVEFASTATLSVNGTVIRQLISTPSYPTVNLPIGCVYNGGEGIIQGYTEGSFYSIRISKNSSVVRDFVPVYRKSDSKPGLYDKVTGNFYTNQGTGEFTLGPEVNTIDDFQKVEYIESTGTQYIDTQIKPNNSLGAKIKYLNPNYVAVNENIWFGASSTTVYEAGANYCLETYNTGNWAFGSGVSNYDISWKGNTIYEFEVNYNGSGKLFINGIEKCSRQGQTSFPDYNLFLFRRNVAGSPDATYSIYSNRIYYCELYLEKELIRDFVPVYRKSDNKPGLFDLVNDKFYTNQGSGEFTVGPDIN